MNLKLNIRTSIIVYFFLLLSLYHFKIKDYYYWNYVAYLQDSFFDFSFYRAIVAATVFLINLFFVLKIDKTKLIFIVLSIFFLLFTIPSLIAFTSSNMYPVNLMLFHQVLFFALYGFSRLKLSFKKVPVLNKKQATYMFFVIITLGILPYLVTYGPHINLKNLILIDVYETRRIMGDLSNPYFGYTYSLFTKILIPLFIVFSMELKNRLMVAFGILYLILFYLFGAHKTVLVALLVVFVFYKLSFFGAIKKILVLSNFLILLSIGLAAIGFDYVWIYSFRRIHFLPTLLDICYLDFFKEKPLYLSESIFKSFFPYPYDMGHAKLIGKNYFNNPDMGANNGLISDGFMNFGTYGVLINVFLVSFYFMLLNSLKIPPRYFGLFVLIVFSFLSSSTLTVFLTHGAIALLLISIFVLNDKKQ